MKSNKLGVSNSKIMTGNHKTPGSEIAELIEATRNLLAFHRRCGLNYPYHPELKDFLEGPTRSAPAACPSKQQKQPDLAEQVSRTESPVKTGEKIVSPDELAAMTAECQACGLSKMQAGRIAAEDGKTRPVKLLIVCDPPAQRAEGSAPIQGEARELLRRMLAAIDLTFEEVCLTGVIKCAPGKEDLPVEQDLKTCLSWLHREVDLFAPILILTLGPLSARLILDTKKQLFTLRGRLQKWRDIPLIPSYHPDMLLRHNELKQASWEDLKLLKKMLNS